MRRRLQHKWMFRRWRAPGCVCLRLHGQLHKATTTLAGPLQQHQMFGNLQTSPRKGDNFQLNHSHC
ncbi:hypothetical protein ACCO45_005228 [Purpureocillium lilacinum]|uniref:Uncharacterized protein n=1 Tax=Purpureocillium lilacinum TaxID=33203 RepID=A0ACC4DV33_PURLI